MVAPAYWRGLVIIRYTCIGRPIAKAWMVKKPFFYKIVQVGGSKSGNKCSHLGFKEEGVTGIVCGGCIRLLESGLQFKVCM